MNKILDSVVALLNAAVADNTTPLYGVIKAVFWGDPQQIAIDDTPCLTVQPVRSSPEREQSRYDRYSRQIEVRLVMNYKQYSQTTPADPRKVAALSSAINLMEKVGTDNKVSAKSVAGILLKNSKLPYTESATTYYAAEEVHLESIDWVFNLARGFPTFEVIALFSVITQADRDTA